MVLSVNKMLLKRCEWRVRYFRAWHIPHGVETVTGWQAYVVTLIQVPEIGTKPLAEPIIPYSWPEPQKKSLVKFISKKLSQENAFQNVDCKM